MLPIPAPIHTLQSINLAGLPSIAISASDDAPEAIIKKIAAWSSLNKTSKRETFQRRKWTIALVENMAKAPPAKRSTPIRSRPACAARAKYSHAIRVNGPAILCNRPLHLGLGFESTLYTDGETFSGMSSSGIASSAYLDSVKLVMVESIYLSVPNL